MTDKLTALKDFQTGATQYIDMHSGKVFKDPEGLHFARQLEPAEWILGEGSKRLTDRRGEPIHRSALSNAAAYHYHTKVAEQMGRPVPLELRDACGGVSEIVMCDPKSRKVTMRDKDGNLVAMDLAITDVHTPATLANYAAGYHITDGIADMISPVIPVTKQSDVYYTWNSSNDFNRKLGVASTSGGSVPEVNPTLGSTTYTAPEFALGGFMPTEVLANADTPLRPLQKMIQMVIDGLRLEREFRVATLLQTSGNWNSNNVVTIAAGAQWDGGAASDPLANLHTIIENSLLPVTGIAWSEKVEHDFLRNPAVQKYFTYKDMVNGIPDPLKLSSTLRLPPIHTAMMKYTSGGAPTYVWGNHVVLIHQPSQMPPTDQMEVATSLTFRWNGGAAPDGTVTAGFLVRTFFDPKRGARGGTQLVVAHNDTELQTSGLVGGLLLNAHQ